MSQVQLFKTSYSRSERKF